MKRLTFIIFLILPFLVHSQSLEKIFFTILDEYVESEPVKKGFAKDNVFLYVSFDKIDKIKNEFALNISMYDFRQYPIVDSLKVYKGFKMLVEYPKSMEKKISKYFVTIKDSRSIKEKDFLIIKNEDGSVEKTEIDDSSIMIESTSNYLFQVNKKNQIYIIGAGDSDNYYYEKLKKKKLKFAKKILFSEDLR